MIGTLRWLSTGALVGVVAMAIWVSATPENDTESNEAAGAPSIRATLPDGRSSADRQRGSVTGPVQQSPLLKVVLRAESDPDGAIAELRAMSDPYVLREAGLALLDVLGNDMTTIERIAAAMPESDRLTFRIDALARRAGDDPLSALEGVLALPDSAARRLAMERIAGEWATADPVGALGILESISDPSLNSAFRASALKAWAETDPEGALAYLSAAGWIDFPSEEGGFDALERLAQAIPIALYEAADRLPGNLGDLARTRSLSVWGEQNVSAALERVETMQGRDRGVLLSSIARGMASSDPGAAFEWMMSFNPPPRQVAVETLNTIAQVDIDRAIDIAFEWPSISGYSAFAALPLDSYPERIPALLYRLTTSGDELAPFVGNVLSDWAFTEPDDAVRWVIANFRTIDQDAVQHFARSMAQQDAAIAVTFVDRMPDELGDTWISAIATNYAIQQPVAAAELALSLPEGGGRDRTIGQLVGIYLGTGEPVDPALMAAISSDEVRDRVIREALPYVQSSNAEEAAKLLAYVSDENLLTDLERRLANARGN